VTDEEDEVSEDVDALPSNRAGASVDDEDDDDDEEDDSDDLDWEEDVADEEVDHGVGSTPYKASRRAQPSHPSQRGSDVPAVERASAETRPAVSVGTQLKMMLQSTAAAAARQLGPEQISARYNLESGNEFCVQEALISYAV